MEICNKTCFSCNKAFRTPADLLRHKKRLTPCVIQNIPKGDEGNPLRCIYCNKVFTRNQHMLRHHGVCKIKNGGTHILLAKTKHERQMDEIQNQMRLVQTKLEEATGKLEEQAEEIKYLKSKPNVVNNTINAQKINITFNAWNAPDFTPLVEPNDQGKRLFIELLSQHGVQLPVKLVDTIWYNPATPHNLSIYLVNKQTEEALCWDGARWCVTDSTTVSRALRDRCYSVTDKLGVRLQDELSNNQQQLIAQIALNKPDTALTRLEIDEIKRAVYTGRNLTKRHHGRIVAG